jgi:hypothetical protein
MTSGEAAAAWAFIALALAAGISGTRETRYLWQLHQRARREDGPKPKAATRLLRYVAIAMTALTLAAYWYGGTTTWAVLTDSRTPTPLRLVGIALAAAALLVPTYIGRGLRRLAAEQLANRLRNLHDDRPSNGPRADR